MSVWLVGWFVTGEVFVSNDLTFGLVSQYARQLLAPKGVQTSH